MPKVKSRDSKFVEAAMQRYANQNIPKKEPTNQAVREASNIMNGMVKEKVKRTLSNRKYTEFIKSVKESFMNQFIYTIFTESLERVDPDVLNVVGEDVRREMINSFIQECGGVEAMLNEYETKTPLLSDVTESIRRYSSMVVEATKDCNKKDCAETSEFKIPRDISTAFYDELNMADFGDVTLQISNRVLDGIDEFLSGNAMMKANIDQIITTAKQKIGSAKAEAQQESASLVAKRRITALKTNTPKTVFDYMMTEAVSDVMKDDTTRASYFHEGAFDIDRVALYCKATYTLLETVNTIKLKNIDEDYVKKALGIA